ncbi:MAG TPA: hypothetical protein PLB00_12835, partial [Pseudomonadota bacterium]|nr:hypothetical protein [Pseudomonadota bacterium]
MNRTLVALDDRVAGSEIAVMDKRPTSASLRKLTELAGELATRGLSLVEAWPVVDIAQLYEQVDNLAAAADLPGAEAVANAALELAVYLSALVESGNAANPAQRDRARGLMTHLAEVSG